MASARTPSRSSTERPGTGSDAAILADVAEALRLEAFGKSTSQLVATGAYALASVAAVAYALQQPLPWATSTSASSFLDSLVTVSGAQCVA